MEISGIPPQLPSEGSDQTFTMGGIVDAHLSSLLLSGNGGYNSSDSAKVEGVLDMLNALNQQLTPPNKEYQSMIDQTYADVYKGDDVGVTEDIGGLCRFGAALQPLTNEQVQNGVIHLAHQYQDWITGKQEAPEDWEERIFSGFNTINPNKIVLGGFSKEFTEDYERISSAVLNKKDQDLMTNIEKICYDFPLKS